MSDISTVDQAKKLVDSLRHGKQFHDEFSKAFEAKYLICGKLMSMWREYFRISIAPDLTTVQCREYSSQIVDKYQEATFFKLAAEVS